MEHATESIPGRTPQQQTVANNNLNKKQRQHDNSTLNQNPAAHGVVKSYGRKRISQTWSVPESLNEQRVHQALLALDTTLFPTTTTAKRNIRKGLILINDNVCGTEDVVHAGDVIGFLQTFGAPERKLPSVIATSIGDGTNDQEDKQTDRDASSCGIPSAVISPLHICYEDKHMVVVVKPQGMPVFSEKDSGLVALATVLCHQIDLHCAQEDSSINYRRRPQPVHRLDRETGGLVLVAKTYSALRTLTEAFVDHKVHKTYMALIEGSLEPKDGTISIPLDGKESTTHYNQKWTKEYEGRSVSMVELNPVTGRKNQLRRYCYKANQLQQNL